MNMLGVAILCLSALSVLAVTPPPYVQQQSLSELVTALKSDDEKMRSDAAAGITWHLSQLKLQRKTPERAVLENCLTNASEKLISDPASVVRLGCINILSQLSAWTNTVPMLVRGFADKDCLVRTRAISVTAEMYQTRNQDVPVTAADALRSCLDPSGNPEMLWQAVQAAGELKVAGQTLVPEILRLLKHENEKVRDYATDALKAIRERA